MQHYKECIIRRKAYEAAQGYLFASPGKIADWDKATTIVYNAGYQLPIEPNKLVITITNLLLLKSLEVEEVKRDLTPAQIKDLQAEAAEIWEETKLEYEHIA